MTPWVLITGSGLRLGREFCLAFAHSGWNVACHYLHSREATETSIAQTGVVLFIDQCVQIQPHFCQSRFNIIIDTQ